MNRKLSRLLAALLPPLFFLSACGGGTAAGGDTIRIGVALYLQEDTFISALAQDLQQTALEEEQARGVKINLTIVDGRGSQTAQNEQVNRFLTRDCDVICVNIVDRTAAAVIIDKAQAAGVPVVFFNREPVGEDLNRWDYAYYVGTRADEAGRLQGSLVLDAWRKNPSAMDRSGDGVLQYVMLEGEPGHQDALLRTEHCVRTLTSAGVSLEKLSSNSADWQRGLARLRMQQWLEELGGGIEAVFANNDDMALGAIDACLESGMTPEELPFIVGVDATSPALKALEEGTLKGTVFNDAPGQARAILALSCALAQGENPEDAIPLEDGKYVWLEHTAVTRETLADLLPEGA